MMKDPLKRWGFKQMKKAKWFDGLDWEKLERKELPTPWQPDQVRLLRSTGFITAVDTSLIDDVSM
jgi:hypothetical protein